MQWFDKELKSMRCTLKLMNDIYKISLDSQLKNNINKFELKYRASIKAARTKAHGNLVMNSYNLSRDAWKIIKKKYNKTDDLVNIEATTFIREFVTSRVNLTHHLPSNHGDAINLMSDMKQTLPLLELCSPTSEVEVRDIFNSFKKRKSLDTHGLSVDVLPTVFNILVTPLTKLVNFALRNRYFPKCLKVARVTPIYKNGDKTAPSNYRPISNLSIFAKIFERIIFFFFFLVKGPNGIKPMIALPKYISKRKTIGHKLFTQRGLSMRLIQTTHCTRPR